MKKKIVLLLLSLCFIGLGYAQNLSVIDPELQQLLEQKSNELISINIIMKSHIDAKKLDTRRETFSDKDAMRKAVMKEFKSFSEASQSNVLSILNAETRSSRVANVKSHWITNMINCEATSDVIYQLSECQDIEAIIYNKTEYMLFDEEKQAVSSTRGMTESVTKVNADDVWNLGFTGKGITVALLDTGVNIDHIDLKDHLWDGGEEYPNHGFNTMDNNHNITDKEGHGTHCAGIICGDGTSGTQTGIAPDATLMCIKVLGDNGEGTIEAIVSGIEFSIENGADVLNLSLGSRFPNAYISKIYRETFVNLLEFEILGVAAAGNDRHLIDTYPVPKNINTPANCPPAWIHPDQQGVIGGTSSIISVGAVDNNDIQTYFSSEGPVTWLGSEWNDYSYDKSNEIEENWLCYDRNYFTDNVGVNGNMSWAIMFPPTKLQQYAGGKLTKIATYDSDYYNGKILIYQGGELPENGTLIHSQSYICYGTGDFVDIALDVELPIDESQNLWIVLETDEGVAYPAASCPMTDDPNGRWFKYKGVWKDIKEYGYSNTWLLRAYVDNFENPIAKTNEEEMHTGLIRPDVVAPGLNIISADNKNNNGHMTQSGTSMAAPCVTGIIALMKEKNPDITPAEICEILETTAVKLSAKKNNKTGSGRVDALAAVEKTEEAEEEDEENDENVQDTTSISKKIYDSKITIYPNPATEELFIATGMNVEEIAIYDIYGRLCCTDALNASTSNASTLNATTSDAMDTFNVSVQDLAMDTFNVSVRDLETGIYFINIKTDKGNVVRRFVKK